MLERDEELSKEISRRKLMKEIDRIKNWVENSWIYQKIVNFRESDIKRERERERERESILIKNGVENS